MRSPRRAARRLKGGREVGWEAWFWCAGCRSGRKDLGEGSSRLPQDTNQARRRRLSVCLPACLSVSFSLAFSVFTLSSSLFTLFSRLVIFALIVRRGLLLRPSIFTPFSPPVHSFVTSDCFTYSHLDLHLLPPLYSLSSLSLSTPFSPRCLSFLTSPYRCCSRLSLYSLTSPFVLFIRTHPPSVHYFLPHCSLLCPFCLLVSSHFLTLTRRCCSPTPLFIDSSLSPYSLRSPDRLFSYRLAAAVLFTPLPTPSLPSLLSLLTLFSVAVHSFLSIRDIFFILFSPLR